MKNTKEIKGIPAEKMEELREPFEDFAYDDASQGNNKRTAIKAIYIAERMNKVFGAGRWEAVWKRVPEFCRSWEYKNSYGDMKTKCEVVVEGKIVLHDYPDFIGSETMAGNDANSYTDAAKGAVTALISKWTSFNLEIGLDVFQGKVSVQGKGPHKKVSRNGDTKQTDKTGNGQQKSVKEETQTYETVTLPDSKLNAKTLKGGKWNMEFHQKGVDYFIWLYGAGGKVKEVKLTKEQKQVCQEYYMENAETPDKLPAMDGDFTQTELAVHQTKK